MKLFHKIAVSAVTLLAVLCAASVVNAQAVEGKKTAVRIVIVKSARTLTLEGGGQPLKTYKVALGGQPVGAKHQQGDHQTPEGEYFVDAKNSRSQFYMALHLSYPNAADRLQARKLGVSARGDVEIHGLGKKFGWIGARHRLTDWTDGCVAVTNEEIEEIFRIVRLGTRVEIRP